MQQIKVAADRIGPPEVQSELIRSILDGIFCFAHGGLDLALDFLGSALGAHRVIADCLTDGLLCLASDFVGGA